MNKKLLDKYGIEKLGLHNGKEKMCLCGTTMDIGEKECPGCGTKLPKSKCINIARNTAIAKRFEDIIDGSKITLNYYHLLSSSFDLYETKMLDVVIDKENSTITVSDPKIFKSLSGKDEIVNFFEKYLPGFMDYVNSGLRLFEYEYAVSNFCSLSSAQLSNYLNVFLNYNALTKYLLGYKVFYYGNKVNLAKYFPSINFNDPEDAKKTNIDFNLLAAWDIKNEKYIETIIDISNTATKEQLEQLDEIITDMQKETKKDWRLEYNDIVEAFGLLFNKDISLNDFLRIKNNSHDNCFCRFNEFKKNYKKCNGNVIDWSQIDGLNRKTLGTVKFKAGLLKGKALSKADINDIYTILEKDPMKALQEMKARVKRH